MYLSGCRGYGHCPGQLFWEASMLARMQHEEAEGMGRGTRCVHAIPDAAVHVFQSDNILSYQSGGSGNE